MRQPTRFTAATITPAKAKQLRKQATNAIKDRDKFKKAAADKDKLIVAKQKQIGDKEKTIRTLSAEKTSFQNKLSTKDRELAKLRTEKSKSDSRVTVKDQQISRLNGEITALKRGGSATAALTADKQRLTTKVGKLETDLGIRNAAITTHLGEIERLKARPATGASETIKRQPTIMPISTAMANIASQVSEAQKQMKAQSFSISNVAIKLKAKADSATGNIKMFDPRSNVATEGLDEIAFEISTDGSGQTETGQERVPDLKGLTAGAATRILATVGLRIDTARGKAPNNAGVTSGQAYKQSPAAGAAIDRGSAVMVIFEQ